jgi:hypothetical protein
MAVKNGAAGFTKLQEHIERNHRYLRKVECSNFVMRPVLALHLTRAFLQQPLTVLTRQTWQAVRAINQSTF